MSDLKTFLSRKSVILAQRRQDYTDNPDAGLVTLTAASTLSHENFARPTRMGSFDMLSDSGVGLGGQALGPSAPEMLLGALASCLVHTYLLQSVLMNIPIIHVEVEVTGKIDLTGVVGLPYEQPPQMQDITYTASVDSPASAEEIQRMHDMVEATCPVLNTIRYPVQVTRTA